MNKKILGIKLSTILTALACIVIAFFIWVVAKYNISYQSAKELDENAVVCFFNGLMLRG